MPENHTPPSEVWLIPFTRERHGKAVCTSVVVEVIEPEKGTLSRRLFNDHRTALTTLTEDFRIDSVDDVYAAIRLSENVPWIWPVPRRDPDRPLDGFQVFQLQR